MKTQPPILADKLLKWFCAPHLLEDIQPGRWSGRPPRRVCFPSQTHRLTGCAVALLAGSAGIYEAQIH
ncbi:hypothetical protein [Runella salmonicolor]|uniref:hypothetical protein n=1 Tax=Runella salmonicolor TaxID=2950278 RepID=UPI004044EC7E